MWLTLKALYTHLKPGFRHYVGMATETARDIALNWVLETEGGLVEHPSDPGGLTKYGLSRWAYPQLDIANLTAPQARRIYVRDYWRAANCHELPDRIAIAVMDGVVNHGTTEGGGWDAVRFLQLTAGTYPDGVVGPVTARAAEIADQNRLMVGYLGRRAQYYRDLVEADRNLSPFFRGWMNRLFGLQARIEQHRNALN